MSTEENSKFELTIPELDWLCNFLLNGAPPPGVTVNQVYFILNKLRSQANKEQ